VLGHRVSRPASLVPLGIVAVFVCGVDGHELREEAGRRGAAAQVNPWQGGGGAAPAFLQPMEGLGGQHALVSQALLALCHHAVI
jgi:hypothetical protein